jgi:selenocysteine-specific elongation factor
LWVDRVFAAKGAGTVVTGTLTGGSLARDDAVVIEPGARRVRIRRIESAHETLDRVGPGNRVALNLAGVDHHEVHRGDAVVRAHQWAVVDTVDVALRLLPARRVAKRASLEVHAGSGEQRARVRLLGAEGHFARMRLAHPLPLAPGDRLVLRSSGAQETVAGAEVLDVAPARRTADAVARLAEGLTARVLAARPWCTPEEFARLAGGATPEGCERVGEWLLASATLEAVRARAAELMREGWPALASVASACGVEVAQLRAALGDERLGDDVRDDPAAHKLLDALDAEPFAPPDPAELGATPALVRELVRTGALVDLDGVIFTADALATARQRIAAAVVERGSLTVADVRDLLGSSRKYVLPIVNRMDADGVTRRRAELRVPGPRAG